MKSIKKIILITIITVLTLSGCTKKEATPFKLEQEYYGKEEFIELNKDELNNLIDKEKTFAVFLFQPFCEAAANFNEVLKEFMNKYKIGIYKMQFKDIKGTNLEKHVKYYPSLVIYEDGKLVDFLKADKDEDTKSFKNMDNFIEWFKKYVIMDSDENHSNTNNENTIENNNKEINKKENNNIDIVLNNVTYDSNKINIYLFWGDGCPHCEKEKAYFENISKEYGKYYNLHTYEVWYNSENQKIFDQFANKMNDEVSGVPYTIIGNKSFIGFNNNIKDEIVKAITSQYQNSYDVYFDRT